MGRQKCLVDSGVHLSRTWAQMLLLLLLRLLLLLHHQLAIADHGHVGGHGRRAMMMSIRVSSGRSNKRR